MFTFLDLCRAPSPVLSFQCRSAFQSNNNEVLLQGFVVRWFSRQAEAPWCEIVDFCRTLEPGAFMALSSGALVLTFLGFSQVSKLGGISALLLRAQVLTFLNFLHVLKLGASLALSWRCCCALKCLVILIYFTHSRQALPWHSFGAHQSTNDTTSNLRVEYKNYLSYALFLSSFHFPPFFGEEARALIIKWFFLREHVAICLDIARTRKLQEKIINGKMKIYSMNTKWDCAFVHWASSCVFHARIWLRICFLISSYRNVWNHQSVNYEFRTLRYWSCLRKLLKPTWVGKWRKRDFDTKVNETHQEFCVISRKVLVWTLELFLKKVFLKSKSIKFWFNNSWKICLNIFFNKNFENF